MLLPVVTQWQCTFGDEMLCSIENAYFWLLKTGTLEVYIFYHNLDRQGWNVSENTNALYSSPGIHSSQIIAEQSLKQFNVCGLLTHRHYVHLSKQVRQLHKFACNPNPLHIRLFSQLSSLTTKCKWAPAPDVSFQTQLKNVTGRQNADVCTQCWNAKL